MAGIISTYIGDEPKKVEKTKVKKIPGNIHVNPLSLQIDIDSIVDQFKHGIEQDGKVFPYTIQKSDLVKENKK